MSGPELDGAELRQPPRSCSIGLPDRFEWRHCMRELAADGTAFGLEALHRDSQIARSTKAPTRIQKWIIARQLFGPDVTE